MRRIRVWLAVSIAIVFTSTGHAEPPPALAAYGALPAVQEPALSPSGRRIALVATLNGKRQLIAREVGGDPIAIAGVGDLKVRDLRWAGEDLITLEVSATQRLGIEYGGFQHEIFNMLVLDLPQRKVRWMLEKNSKALNAEFSLYGYRQRNGRWYAYVGTQPISRDSLSGATWVSNSNLQLTQVDIKTGEQQLAAGAAKDGRGWLVDSQGNILASERYDNARQMWVLYAGARRDRRLAEHSDPFSRNSIIGQGRSAGTVLYAMRDENDSPHYMEASLAGESKPIEILEEGTVEHFIFDPVTGLLVGVLWQTDRSDLVMFDSALKARIGAALKPLKSGMVTFQSWSDDFTRFVVLTEGSDDSGTWWLLDIASGKSSQIGWRYPMVKGSQVGSYRLVAYKAADGLDLEGILTLPPGIPAEKLPLVVLPHGGPEARDYLEFDWWAQAFASRGYAVWQPNFRGSSGYGIALRNAGFGELGRKMQTDISDGVKELAHRGIVEAQRACIVGASYGGYAALAGVTVQQGLYRCAVSVGGVADWRDLMLNSWYASTRYWQAFLGSKNFSNAVFEGISPVSLAKRADAPVLLIHGKDDTVVPFDQSKTMRRALLAAGKPVELVELQGEDHWLSRAQTRTQMLEAAVAFVVRHNPP